MVLNKLKACVCLLILGTAVCTLAFARPDPNASDLPSRRVSNEDRPPQPKEVNSPKSDLARLEGAWMGEYKGDVIYYVFTAGKCTTINATNRQAVTYQFKLDEKKSPKRLDLTAAGKTVEAIYELTGNSLRIAAAHPSVRFYPLVGLAERIVARPTEFVDKDNNVTMITLKRITSEPEVRKGLTRTTGSGEPFSTLRGFRFNDAINNSLLPTAPTRSDLEILEAQVKVKQARVNATLVRLRSAEDRNKIIASLPANQISRLEREAYKAEVDAALADLEVRKAELVEVTAKYRAAQRSNVSVPQGTSSPYGFRKSPSKKDDTPVHEVNSRSLQLPLNIDPTRLKNIKELQLYVSGDFGKSWALASGVAGNAKSIRYEAPKYGEYWFSLRIVQTDGIMVPSSINDLKPVVKVRFVPDSVGK